MLEAQVLAGCLPVFGGQVLEPGHDRVPGGKIPFFQEPAPVLAQNRRHQRQVAAGAVDHVRFQVVEQGLQVFAGDLGKITHTLPEHFVIVGGLGHEGQDVGVITLHGGGQSGTLGSLKTQAGKTLHRETSPVGMAQLMDHAYGLGLADAGPAL